LNQTNDIASLLDTMASQLLKRTSAYKKPPLMVGIHTGGVWVAKALHSRMGMREPLGELDISFYRDDFTRIGMNPQVRPSQLPFGIDGRDIVLIDDVLHTGRTVRAAMNELFDYGRPDSILLAVLVDRGGRELPIEANVIGSQITLNPDEHIKLCGPDPLKLEVRKVQ